MHHADQVNRNRLPEPHLFSVMTRALDPYGLPMRRRLVAIFALVVAAATLALAIAVAMNQFPRGLVLLGCVLIAGVSAWYGLRRRGIARVVGVIVAGIALVGAVALIVVGGARFVDLLIVAGLLVSLAAASAAFTIHVDLPSAHGAAATGAVLQSALRWWEGGTLPARQGGS